MRAKILVSILFGLLLPWAYFLAVEITPMNIYKSGVLIGKAAYKNELIIFIEFHGWLQALLLYLIAFLACSLCTLIICFTHAFVARKLKINL